MGHRKKSRQWQRARKYALGRYGHSCYWCGLKLVNVSDIPDRNRIKLTWKMIVWRGDGKVKNGFIATVDHVKPFFRSRQHEIGKVVPSCTWCNQFRGRFLDVRFKSTYPSQKARIAYIKKFTNRVRKYQRSKKIIAVAE